MFVLIPFTRGPNFCLHKSRSIVIKVDAIKKRKISVKRLDERSVLGTNPRKNALSFEIPHKTSLKNNNKTLNFNENPTYEFQIVNEKKIARLN